MKKETLSDKIFDHGNPNTTYLYPENVKEKIKEAKDELKKFNWFKIEDEEWEETLIRHNLFMDKVFLDKFGDKLTMTNEEINKREHGEVGNN